MFFTAQPTRSPTFPHASQLGQEVLYCAARMIPAMYHARKVWDTSVKWFSVFCGSEEEPSWEDCLGGEASAVRFKTLPGKSHVQV